MTQNTQIEARALEKFQLWFFRDVSDEQRLALFSIFGMPVDEIGKVHGHQRRALKHILNAFALREAPVPSEEPVGEQWRALEYGEPVTSWRDLELGDRVGWLAIARRSPDKYVIETRPLFASPAVAPVGDNKHDADQLNYRQALIEAVAPVASVKRDWVNCPICHEPDMRMETDADGNSLIYCVNHGCASNILSSIIPATKGGEARPSYSQIIDIVNGCVERMQRSGESYRMFSRWVSEAIDAALAQDTDGVAKP